MQLLKHRRVPQTAPHEGRVHRLFLIRWIYILSVIGLALWMFDLFFGGLFYFRSEGLVIGESGIVAAEFPVTVRDLMIREGEVVKAGQVAAVVTSQSVAESIARLSTDFAARQARLSELRVRNHVVDALLPLAENRQKLATHAREELGRLLTNGLTALNTRTDSVELEYRAQHELETLRAEKRTMDGEISTLTAAWNEVEKAIGDLRGLYDEGRVRVPIDGVVSRRLASKGSVLRAGDPLFEMYGTNRFVFAYLPTGTLYTVGPGEEVQVSTGLHTYRGTITRIEPYAAALPVEFQRSFTPVERQQVMRVEFRLGETPPPLLTKVQLKSAWATPRWLAIDWSRYAPDWKEWEKYLRSLLPDRG